MTLVDEAAADRARPGVQIFVIAPHGEVRIPIVQMQQRITRRMRQVQTHLGADASRSGNQRA